MGLIILGFVSEDTRFDHRIGSDLYSFFLRFLHLEKIFDINFQGNLARPSLRLTLSSKVNVLSLARSSLIFFMSRVSSITCDSLIFQLLANGN